MVLPDKRRNGGCYMAGRLDKFMNFLKLTDEDDYDDDEMYDSYDEKELKREEKRMQREQKRKRSYIHRKIIALTMKSQLHLMLERIHQAK